MSEPTSISMSDAAEAYHSELWWWLWHGTDSHRTIGDKKAELRAKYGDAAEAEVIAKLKSLGLLKESV